MQTKKVVVIGDKQIKNIPVYECCEKLVDLRDFNDNIIVDETQAEISSDSQFFCYVRSTIANKLETAQLHLPKGIRFLIKEAYRPAKVQVNAFMKTFEGYRQKCSHLDERQIYEETCKYVAPIETAPHPTGGAVDITLADENDIELDLGTQFNATPWETDYATYLEANNISLRARRNREILKQVLKQVGLVNYFSEWWHWSYGDKYWAYQTAQAYAIYDVIRECDIVNYL